jgi:hypothetical protein
LAVLVVLAWETEAASAASPGDRDIAILEAAIRWALVEGEEPIDRSRIYLALDGHTDPPESLLRRLRDFSDLQRVSDCPRVTIGGREYPEPECGATLVLLHSLKWHSRTRASVWVIRDGPRGSAIGCREHFRLKRDKWTHTHAPSGEGIECGIE